MLRRKKVSQVVLLVLCLLGISAQAADLDPAVTRSPRLTPEQAAARDALRRFVSSVKVAYLPIAPDPLLGDVMPVKVEGRKLEFITREALVARHRGERRAPMIVAVTVQAPAVESDTEATITVLVALEMAAIEGFEEIPDGVGREYVYRPTASGVEFVKEQEWVE